MRFCARRFYHGRTGTEGFFEKKNDRTAGKNRESQADMAALLHCNKSTLSRVEKVGDPTSYKNVLSYAEMYCGFLGLTEELHSYYFSRKK